MRAVLLAAGRGNRLRPLTDRLPKCLLEVGGRTVLSRAVGTLADHGVRRFTVVDGFEAQAVRAALAAEFPSEWFTAVHNAEFDTTNNAYSLLLARAESDEPMLLLDSDIVFEPAVVARLLAAPQPNRLALRTRGGLGDEEMKVVLDDDGRVTDIGKSLSPARSIGESVGLEVFDAPTSRALFATLARRLADPERRAREWYEAAFVELIENGTAVYPVDLENLACMEIDTVADLGLARRLFAEGSDRQVQ